MYHLVNFDIKWINQEVYYNITMTNVLLPEEDIIVWR